MTTLSELCTSVDYGYTASASDDPSAGPKYLRITDIVPDSINWATVPHCEIEDHKRDKFLLDEGDIVIARTGATVGYAKQIWARPEGATFASYLVRFRPNPAKVDAYYLGQVVQSATFKKWVKSVAGGAAQPNANAKLLGSFDVELPSLGIQRSIACIMKVLDDLLGSNRRRIEILEEMARLLYREWFVHFRFPGHEDVKMVDSDLGPIPEGWDVARLSDLVSTQYGYTESANTNPVGPRYLRGMDMNKSSFIDWSSVPFCPISEPDRQKFAVQVGDVFVIRMADPGKVGICEWDVDAVFASYLVRLRPTEDRITPYYLFFTLSDEPYQGWVTGASTGSTRKSVSAKVMTEPSIVVPCTEALKRFDEAVRPVRSLLNTLLEQSALIRQARDLLLPQLVSGELEVSELDSDLVAM